MGVMPLERSMVRELVMPRTRMSMLCLVRRTGAFMVEVWRKGWEGGRGREREIEWMLLSSTT